MGDRYLTNKTVTRYDGTDTVEYVHEYIDPILGSLHSIPPIQINQSDSYRIDATKTLDLSYLGYFPQDPYKHFFHVVDTSTETRQTTSSSYPLPTGDYEIDRDYDTSANLLLVEEQGGLTNGGIATENQYFLAGSGANSLELEYTRRWDSKNNKWQQTDFINYHRGIAQLETRPDQTTVSRVVNDTGTIASETDARGNTTSYQYDGLNRLTYIDIPAAVNQTRDDVVVNWNPTGRTVTRGAYAQTTTFDGLGRTICVQTNDIYKEFRYNERGDTTYESLPKLTPCTSPVNTNGSPNPANEPGTTYEFDVLGTLKKVTHPDNTFREYAYTGSHTVDVTDERGNVTTTESRLASGPQETTARETMDITYPNDIRLALERVNTAGNITQGSVEELVGSNWQTVASRFYDFSDSDRVLDNEIDPEREAVNYEYDSLERMTSRKVGKDGPITTYDYDDMNRTKLIDYADGTPDVSFGYGPNGNVKTVIKGSTSKTYNYDVNNNLDDEAHTYDTITFNIDYTYNSLDFLDSITYPSGRVVTYSPDALGRPTQASGFVTNITWHPSGRTDTITYINGRTLTQTENARTWPERKTVNGTAMDLQYQYDGLGNVTSITDHQTSGQSKTMGYDGINRLTSVSGPWGAGTFIYDALGNITTQTLGSETNLNYDYSSGLLLSKGNRLTDITDLADPSNNASFEYDYNGNILSDGKRTFIYDEASNLIEVLCTQTEPGIFYTYDGDNMRIKERIDGTDRYFVYSKGGQLMGEYDALGNMLKEYIYLGTELIAEVTP